MKYPEFHINFHCDLDFDGVCRLLSERLFLGVPFEPSDYFEEVPSRALPGELLGMQVIVAGSVNAPGRYHITCEPVWMLGEWGASRNWPECEPVHFMEYLASLLERTGRITAIRHKE